MPVATTSSADSSLAAPPSELGNQDLARTSRNSGLPSSSVLSTQSSALLPPLPPPDESLITRLFQNLAYSLQDLFNSLANDPIDGAPRSLLDLFRWSQRDDIKAWLDFHAAQIAAAIRRRQIARLEHIADTTKCQVEARRACTTILRQLALAARPAKPTRPSPPSPQPPGHRSGGTPRSLFAPSTSPPASFTLPSSASPIHSAASYPPSPSSVHNPPPNSNPSQFSPSREAATAPSQGRKPLERSKNSEAPTGRHVDTADSAFGTRDSALPPDHFALSLLDALMPTAWMPSSPSALSPQHSRLSPDSPDTS